MYPCPMNPVRGFPRLFSPIIPALLSFFRERARFAGYSALSQRNIFHGDNENACRDIEAAHPAENLFGIRRKEVAGAGIGIDDEKQCRKRHKPNSEFLPRGECLRNAEANEKY